MRSFRGQADCTPVRVCVAGPLASYVGRRDTEHDVSTIELYGIADQMGDHRGSREFAERMSTHGTALDETGLDMTTTRVQSRCGSRSRAAVSLDDAERRARTAVEIDGSAADDASSS